MKLELKHLAPYLPYRINPLKIQHNGVIKTLEGLSGGWNVSLRSGSMVWDNIHVETIKSVLRPLSDLTKTLFQFEYGNPCTLEEWINGNWDLGNYKWVLEKCQQDRLYDTMPYGVWEEILPYHFDVFGLIEAGLAIDINTLKND